MISCCRILTVISQKELATVAKKVLVYILTAQLYKVENENVKGTKIENKEYRK